MIAILSIATFSGVHFTATTVRAQNQASVNEILPPGYYNYSTVTVVTPSLFGYFAVSNSSVDVAVMTPEQYSAFTQSADINNSIYSQSGEELYDILFLTQGSYYFVQYSPLYTAKVTAGEYLDSNISITNSTTNVGVFLTLQGYQTLRAPVHLETLGSPSSIYLLGASNQTVTYTLTDNSTGNEVIASQPETITNLTYTNGNFTFGYTEKLAEGLYVLEVQNPHPSPAFVYVGYTLTPDYVNPYLVRVGAAAPTGIAAFGVYNVSGKIIPYTVSASSIVGFADITSISAQDMVNATVTSEQASLQMNNVLVVLNSDNTSYVYWPQNVLAFDTGSAQVSYRDNVLNITGDGAQLSNQTISGSGFVSGTLNGGQYQTYYGNYLSNNTYHYSFPFAVLLFMNETVQPRQGVLIQMGVQVLRDGASAAGPIDYYDRIMLNDPGVKQAAFLVTGKAYTPAGAASLLGTYYDSELVFGGGAGGQMAHYTSLRASLSLYYDNGTLHTFPSLYTFGDDTAESADDILVTSSDGAAYLTTGKPSYALLTNSFTSNLTYLEDHLGGASPRVVFTVGDLLLSVAVVLGVVFVGFRVRRHSGASSRLPVQTLPASASYCTHCGLPLAPGDIYCSNCGTARSSS